VNLPVAVPESRLGQLPDLLPERGTGISMTLIALGDPRTADGSTGSPLINLINCIRGHRYVITTRFREGLRICMTGHPEA